jgi:hypothetical protein
MKYILIAALLIASPLAARADKDADNSEASRKQVLAMVACDPSGHFAARFMGAFVGATLASAMVDDAATNKESDAFLEEHIASKTCADHEATYRHYVAFGKKLTGIDYDEYSKTAQGQAEENELAATIEKLLKESK